MATRVIYLDIVRILACWMVVFMHSPLKSADANGMFLSASSYLLSPCIGLFFMVSGALLLPHVENTFVFLRKRFTKIVYPTFIWSLIYILVNRNQYDSISDLFQAFISIPFSAQGNGVMWFLYVLIGLYLLSPILSKWLTSASKREIEFYLFLWLLTQCYPILQYLFTINSSETGLLYYFSGYLGYFLLGFYLNRYSFKMSWASSLFILSLGVVTLFKVLDVAVDFYQMFWYLSIFSTIQCVFWFVLIRKIFSARKQIWGMTGIQQISSLSFGVYLMHILIMRNFLWQNSMILGIENYVIQSIVIAILTFALSCFCSYIISCTSLGKYVVGYKQKRK